MQTILTGFAARALTRDLPDLDAHQLRDMGVTRAADGSLRLLDDPTISAVQPARRAKLGTSWVKSLADFLRHSRRLKTAL
jgi:hypothetical protein